jgi:hypothetical protein
MRRASLIPFLVLAACGNPPPAHPDAGSSPVLLLYRVGAEDIPAHADEIVTLTAQLVSIDSSGLGTPVPVSGVTVTFKITSAPGSVSLAFESSPSDSNGLAQTRITLGNVSHGSLTVEANATGATSTAVWNIAL